MKIFDLFEGGMALKKANVTRIKREDIPATLHFISKISGIPENDLHTLGSVGKNPTSGDIDLAIDISKYDPETIHKKMIAAVGSTRSVYNKGNKIGSYAIPIAGDENKGLVQVDFMYVPNVDWAKFAYFSAGEKSKYKGAVRTVLLRSVASTLDEKGTDMFVYEPTTNELLIRVGRTMDMNTGLRRIIQLRPKRKQGEGYVKTMKTITMDELENTYPDLNFSELKNVATISNPKDALKVMFGFDVTPSDVETAEQIIRLIKKLPMDRQKKIFQKARETFLNNKLLTNQQIDDLFNEI